MKKFVKDVANHCTKEKIDLEFTQWANGEADVAIFEFTSRSHAKEAALVKEPKGKKKLLMGLVGDSLKQVRCKETLVDLLKMKANILIWQVLHFMIFYLSIRKSIRLQ